MKTAIHLDEVEVTDGLFTKSVKTVTKAETAVLRKAHGGGSVKVLQNTTGYRVTTPTDELMRLGQLYGVNAKTDQTWADMTFPDIEMLEKLFIEVDDDEPEVKQPEKSYSQVTVELTQAGINFPANAPLDYLIGLLPDDTDNDAPVTEADVDPGTKPEKLKATTGKKPVGK